VADTVGAVERNVRDLYGSYAEGLGETARAHAAGLKAGVKAGMSSLLNDLNTRKEGSP